MRQICLFVSGCVRVFVLNGFRCEPITNFTTQTKQIEFWSIHTEMFENGIMDIESSNIKQKSISNHAVVENAWKRCGQEQNDGLVKQKKSNDLAV